MTIKTNLYSYTLSKDAELLHITQAIDVDMDFEVSNNRSAIMDFAMDKLGTSDSPIIYMVYMHTGLDNPKGLVAFFNSRAIKLPKNTIKIIKLNKLDGKCTILSQNKDSNNKDSDKYNSTVTMKLYTSRNNTIIEGVE